MAYGEKVLDQFENPRNVGTFEENESIGTGMVVHPPVVMSCAYRLRSMMVA